MNTNFPHGFPPCKPVYPLNADEELLYKDLAVIISENLESTDFGRRASKESIEVLLTFLLRRGFPGQALQALNRVVSAFDDLKAGIQPELFDLDETADTRKWTRSSDGKEMKRHTAAAMGALMGAGMSKGAAARKVARHARIWPRFSNGVIKPSTVANWRDKFLQAPQSQEHQLYAVLLDNLLNRPEYLDEILAKGPPLTFGNRRSTET